MTSIPSWKFAIDILKNVDVICGRLHVVIDVLHFWPLFLQLHYRQKATKSRWKMFAVCVHCHKLSKTAPLALCLNMDVVTWTLFGSWQASSSPNTHTHTHTEVFIGASCLTVEISQTFGESRWGQGENNEDDKLSTQAKRLLKAKFGFQVCLWCSQKTHFLMTQWFWIF